MKVLVWHWGRHGAGPRFAAELAAGLNGLPGISAVLSLAEAAEILTTPDPPPCEWPVPTYSGWAGLATRYLTAPAMLHRLDRDLARLSPDLAICAMPAPLDPLMLRALRRRGIPSLVIAHDAIPHAGDGGTLRAAFDRALLRQADAIGVLSAHVVATMTGLRPAQPMLRLWHPPFTMPPAPPPLAHGGPLRVLALGRLRAYKGLELLAETLRRGDPDWNMRVIGAGPETATLATLRQLQAVRVENRWVPEAEFPSLLAWADVLLLTHRAASQSGIAAAALGAGRFIVATAVGGLAEQLRTAPGATLCPPDPAALANALRAIPGKPTPAPHDTAADWQQMAMTLLQGMRRAGWQPASRDQRQPRAIAAASCSAVRSGPACPPVEPTPPRPPA